MLRLAILVLVVSGAAAAQDKVSFPSRDADATPIDGYILKPAGAGPFPAVVLHHGCGGMWGRNDRISAREMWWMRHLVSLGYAAMEVDSFRPRGLTSVCGDREKSPAVLAHRPADSYGALAWLQTQRDIDGARVAVMGFSHGGSTVLGTAWHAQPTRLDGAGYRAAIAFYPGCGAWARDPGAKVSAPLLILIGEADDWTPARPCRSYATSLRRLDQPAELVVYPDAHHGFDTPNQPIRVLPDIPNANGGKGVTIGTNEPARQDAIARVDAWLDRHLRQP